MDENGSIAAERPIEQVKENQFSVQSSSYELKGLKQIHHEIIILCLIGYNNVTIAEKLGVTPNMVGYTLDSQLVKEKLAILRKERDKEHLDVFARIEELAPLALAEMEYMLVNPDTNEVNKRQIAQDILDRAGYSAVKKTADVTDQLKTSDIDEIKELARNAGMMVEKIENAEETETEEIN